MDGRTAEVRRDAAKRLSQNYKHRLTPTVSPWNPLLAAETQNLIL